MSANAEMINAFYRAFQHRDYATMSGCYHEDIHFSDPVFPDLRGSEARAMWHMLCDRGVDLDVTFDDVSTDGDRGAARWEARYTVPSTGRFVHNRVDASFRFRDGKIIRHVDDFDLWRWTRLALGASGILAGWTPFVQQKVRAKAESGLRRFIDEHPEYTSDP